MQKIELSKEKILLNIACLQMLKRYVTVDGLSDINKEYIIKEVDTLIQILNEKQ